MALSISLPIHKSQYIPTSTSFLAPFNTIAPGRYSFDIPANENAQILRLDFGSHYLIERMFISGNIAAEDYLTSIDNPAIAPTLQIRRLKDAVMTHVSRIPVIQFSPNREAPVYIYSDKKEDYIMLTMRGNIAQVANTVGVDPLIVTIGLSIYQINEKYFTQGMRTAIQENFGLSKKSSS
jgi:hypothetical protein